MIGGIERYFQIARCFRDEDLRADRQPEFTQVDIEMSFVNEEIILSLIERLMVRIFSDLLGITLSPPFPRMSYESAMERFGTDAPDLRNPLRIFGVSDLFQGTGIGIFQRVLSEGGEIFALPLPRSTLSRKELDDLGAWAKEQGFSGLAWVRIQKESWQGPIARHLSQKEKDALIQQLSLNEGDLLFFGAGPRGELLPLMGRLRQHLCDLVGIRSKGYELLWVLDFPMFTFNPEERRLEAVHHPFTAPKEEDKSLLSRDPLRVRSRAYDLVLNGIELGGGSIRNHRYPDQKEIFERLGIPPEVYEDRFGFLLRALKHGAPPHGGIALGLDRLTMLLSGAQSLREVIAFPKTQRGQDLLFEAPSSVDPEQLLELKIRIVDAGEVR
jgi:aspartyl-tRNA synthetase